MKNEFRIRNTLKKIDLTEIEITVYLNLLQMGEVPASILAKRLNLNRSTTRYTLENLKKKQLVLQQEKNKSFYFIAENPEKILLLLKTQKEKILKKEREMSHIIGDLKNLQNPHMRMPKVQVFEGPDRVKQAYENFLKNIPKESTIFSYSNLLPPEVDTQNYRESVQAFIKQRKLRKIFIKYLMPKTQRTLDYLNRITADNIEIKMINLKKIPFNTDLFGGQILIFKDTILSVFMNEDTAFAYKMTHFEITAMHQHVFETLWDQIPLESSSIKK